MTQVRSVCRSAYAGALVLHHDRQGSSVTESCSSEAGCCCWIDCGVEWICEQPLRMPERKDGQDLALRASGRIVLRYDWDLLDERPDAVEEEIRVMLRAREEWAAAQLRGA